MILYNNNRISVEELKTIINDSSWALDETSSNTNIRFTFNNLTIRWNGSEFHGSQLKKSPTLCVEPIRENREALLAILTHDTRIMQYVTFYDEVLLTYYVSSGWDINDVNMPMDERGLSTIMSYSHSIEEDTIEFCCKHLSNFSKSQKTVVGETLASFPVELPYLSKLFQHLNDDENRIDILKSTLVEYSCNVNDFHDGMSDKVVLSREEIENALCVCLDKHWDTINIQNALSLYPEEAPRIVKKMILVKGYKPEDKNEGLLYEPTYYDPTLTYPINSSASIYYDPQTMKMYTVDASGNKSEIPLPSGITSYPDANTILKVDDDSLTWSQANTSMTTQLDDYIMREMKNYLDAYKLNYNSTEFTSLLSKYNKYTSDDE